MTSCDNLYPSLFIWSEPSQSQTHESIISLQRNKTRNRYEKESTIQETMDGQENSRQTDSSQVHTLHKHTTRSSQQEQVPTNSQAEIHLGQLALTEYQNNKEGKPQTELWQQEKESTIQETTGGGRKTVNRETGLGCIHYTSNTHKRRAHIKSGCTD